MMKNTLYVLKLEGNNYYVGTTDNLYRRFDEHCSGQGAKWTSLYKPIDIVFTLDNPTKFDENNYTKEYMIKYGIDKVRGGSYCNIQLNDSQLNTLRQELNTATNSCYNCGQSGHFSKRCPNRRNSTKSKVTLEVSSSAEPTKKKTCYNCGQPGHFSKQCPNHRNSTKSKVTLEVSSSVEPTKRKTCSNCKQPGHYAPTCPHNFYY